MQQVDQKAAWRLAYQLFVGFSRSLALAPAKAGVPANCQDFDNSVVQRRSNWSAPGGATADDFVPLSGTITSITAWGSMTEPDANGDSVDCSTGFVNQFQVRLYGSDLLGLPDVGFIVVEKTIDAAHVTQTLVAGSTYETVTGIPVFRFDLDLSDQPITGLDASGSTCYWLEIKNAGTGSCGWNWQVKDSTVNDFSAVGTFGDYGPASARNGDMAFCLSTDIQPGACGTPIGYCCDCAPGHGGACVNTDRRTCLDGGGRWRIDLTCETATGDDVCAEAPPPNDACSVVLAGGVPSVSAGTYLFDNTCATVDGVNPVTTETGDSRDMQADVWFKYIASGLGNYLYISTCHSGTTADGGTDTILAAYRDPDNPSQCICPSNAAEQDAAVAWYTDPSQIFGTVHAGDENCDFLPDGSGGYIAGDVQEGDCFMIRVGGIDPSAEGLGVLTISQFIVDNWPLFTLVDAGNRYIVVDPIQFAAGRASDVVLRVRPLSLDHTVASESVLYVGPPYDAPDENIGSPGQTFRVAPLQCDPYAHSWTTEPPFAIYGAEIMPNSEYAIESTYASCPNLTTNGGCWSDSLIATTRAFGDSMPPFDGSGPAQPDFVDITAAVDKFLAIPVAQPKYRIQLQPNVVFPFRPVDFRDISMDVDAFRGITYASMLPGPCSCPSAVTCDVTPCANDTPCGDGFCINGFCRDACGRCAP